MREAEMVCSEPAPFRLTAIVLSAGQIAAGRSGHSGDGSHLARGMSVARETPEMAYEMRRRGIWPFSRGWRQGPPAPLSLMSRAQDRLVVAVRAKSTEP